MKKSVLSSQFHFFPTWDMHTLMDQIQCQNTIKENYNYFIILMGSDSQGQ